jgi:hypothetical protein
MAIEPLQVRVQVSDGQQLEELKKQAAALDAQVQNLFNQGEIQAAIHYQDQLAKVSAQIAKINDQAAKAKPSLANTYEFAGAGVGVNAAQVEQALDRETAAAVEATRAHRFFTEALEEEALAQRQVFVAAMQNAEAQMALAGKAGSASMAVGAAGVSANRSAMGFLFLSQAIEDAQYGFSAVVNNIPMIVMAMGGTAGLAGAVSVLAVGANIAINHWEELQNALRLPQEREAAEQMAELAKRTEDAAKAFDNLKDARTRSQKQSGEAFTQGMTEGDPRRFQKQMAEALTSTGQAPSVAPTFSQTVGIGIHAIAQEMMNDRNAQDVVKEDLARMQGEATTEKAAAFLGAVAQGDEAARSKLATLMRLNPGAFGNEFREAFKKSAPGYQENEALTKEATDKQNQAALRENEMRNKAREEALTEQDKQVREQARLNEYLRKDAFKNEMQGIDKQKDALQEQAKNVRKEMRDAPKAEINGSTQDMLRSVQMTALQGPEKEQIKKLDAINEKLEQLNKTAKEKRAAFFG